MTDNFEVYKNQMETLYKEQYEKELKFDEIKKRGKFLVGVTKKKEMRAENRFHSAHDVSSATYFVVPLKKGTLDKEGLLMQIESAPKHVAHYYDRDGQNDYTEDNTISLEIRSGKEVLAEVISSLEDPFNIDARDNAQVSAWLKQEYQISPRQYKISSDIVSKAAELSQENKRIMKEKTLKFAQNFMKKFACEGNDFVREGERLKRVEKIGILRKRVSDKWRKAAEQKAQDEKETARNKLLKDVSGQQDIMDRYIQKSIKERIFDWFK